MKIGKLYGRPGRTASWRVQLRANGAAVSLTGITPVLHIVVPGAADVTFNGVPDADQTANTGYVTFTAALSAVTLDPGEYDAFIVAGSVVYPTHEEERMRVWLGAER